MNYERIYNQIIERGKQRLLEGYGENHHIIPKCIGGADTQDNIVRLTAREHFICHLLLIEVFPDTSGLYTAAYFMANTREGLRVGARTYALLREANAKVMSKRVVSQETRDKMARRMTGTKLSKETREKISKSNKGKVNRYKGMSMEEMFGKEKADEIKAKKSKALKGKPSTRKNYKPSEETKRKQSEALKGKPSPHRGRVHTEEAKKKMSEVKLGKKYTKESIEKRIATLAARPNVICPHCQKEGRGNAMKQHHFKNCKSK